MTAADSTAYNDSMSSSLSSEVQYFLSQWFSKSTSLHQGLCNNFTADARKAAFHPHLLSSPCSHTVDFYETGLVPAGCKTGILCF